MRVLATVNGEDLLVEQFKTSYVDYLISTGSNDTPQAKRQHLDGLLNTYLLAQEARRRGLDTDSSFQAFADRAIREVLGSRFVELTFLDSLEAPSEAELREAFRRTNTSVELRHLFFRDEQQARSAYEQLRRGADFVKLANQLYRTPAFDSTAGYLGVIGYWDLDDAVAEAAFATLPGSYTSPVRSKWGWHILRVEGFVHNPLLTEQVFQERRSGLESRMRLRRYNLEGARFVERLMSRAKTKLDPEGVRLLTDALRQLTGGSEAGEKPEEPLSTEEVQQVRERLDPETVLATYEAAGTAYTFTALDYARWLDALPGSEVRARPGLSVGRALRNEVLAALALGSGMEADSTTLSYVDFATTRKLAQRIAESARAEGPANPTEEELEEAFTRLGYHRGGHATASFWTVQVNSLQEAEAVLKEIEAGSVAPEAMTTYRRYDAADLSDLGGLAGHIRRAPRGRTVVLGAREGEWMLLHVSRLDAPVRTLDDVRGQLVKLLAPNLNEMRLLTRLRKEADLHVDWAVFESVLPHHTTAAAR